MNITSRRVCTLGILFSVGVLWAGVGHSIAADGPGQLQPVPEQSPSVAQPPAYPLQGDSLVTEYDEGVEFDGLPVCGPPGRFWLRADYLMWWTSGMNLPALVTTSPPGTPLAQAGALPPYGNAIVVYGNGTVNNDMRSGFRTTIGMWLDACHVWDLEFDYLSLGERANNYTSPYSTGNPIYARPYYDVENNHQSRELVAFTDVIEGQVSVDARDYFQSAGVTVSYNLCSCNSCGDSCDSCDDSCAGTCGPPLLYCCRTDLLVGYRYYNLNDSVTIREDLQDTQPGPTLGWRTEVHDYFRARNDFHGGEIGLRSKKYCGRWSVDILAKLAIGNNHRVVTIDGQTIVTPTDQPRPDPRPNGVFANRSNMGTYPSDAFTVIPQMNLELGYQVNCHWRAYVGYNILFWGCVSRAADQIDLNLDTRNLVVGATGLPFPAKPDSLNRSACFWAQGVNLGTEFRF